MLQGPDQDIRSVNPLSNPLEKPAFTGYRRVMTETHKLMVFDLDGTLVDTAADLIDALNVSLEKQDLPNSDATLARAWIGHGARRMIRNAMEALGHGHSEEREAAMFKDFLEYYQANISRHSRPFPSLIEALAALRQAGWVFAVCSNKQERYCRLLLDQLEMSELFTVIAGGDTFGVSKPDARHLLGTIEAANGAREQTIMVGDASTDVDAAKAAQVPVIGVTFGYSPVPIAELEPDILLDHYRELTPEFADRLLVRNH